jgi:hypothetical protein
VTFTAFFYSPIKNVCSFDETLNKRNNATQLHHHYIIKAPLRDLSQSTCGAVYSFAPAYQQQRYSTGQSAYHATKSCF